MQVDIISTLTSRGYVHLLYTDYVPKSPSDLIISANICSYIHLEITEKVAPYNYKASLTIITSYFQH